MSDTTDNTDAPGERKPQSMLYEVCPRCGGKGGVIGQPFKPSFPCCKMLGVVETGVTVGQLEGLVKLNTLRQEVGISAAMLRDGRAAQALNSAFKSYVHARLDAAGVPPDPEPEITKATGCRIGGRLNWVLERMVKL